MDFLQKKPIIIRGMGIFFSPSNEEINTIR